MSGFLLWFLMPPADPYIRMTESAVCYTVYMYSESKLFHTRLVGSKMSVLKKREKKKKLPHLLKRTDFRFVPVMCINKINQ